jgi:hypothetical protein
MSSEVLRLPRSLPGPGMPGRGDPVATGMWNVRGPVMAPIMGSGSLPAMSQMTRYADGQGLAPRCRS